MLAKHNLTGQEYEGEDLATLLARMTGHPEPDKTKPGETLISQPDRAHAPEKTAKKTYKPLLKTRPKRRPLLLDLETGEVFYG